MHEHHAFQLTFGAGGYANIRTPSGLLHGPVILIAPDAPHLIEPEGRIVLVFVEPESRYGAALRRMMAGSTTMERSDLPLQQETMSAIWSDPRPSDGEVVKLGSRLIDALLGREDTHPEINSRVQRVIHWHRANPEAEMSVSDAASLACLSESRFSHLFVEQVGLPFRRYLLWKRLEKAVEYLAAGANLTTAAHQAGFADSAHFSRTFQRMFGIPAVTLEFTAS